MESKKKYWTGKLSQTQDIKKMLRAKVIELINAAKRDPFDLERSYEKEFKVNFKIFKKILFFVSIFFLASIKIFSNYYNKNPFS